MVWALGLSPGSGARPVALGAGELPKAEQQSGRRRRRRSGSRAAEYACDWCRKEQPDSCEVRGLRAA